MILSKIEELLTEPADVVVVSHIVFDAIDAFCADRVAKNPNTASFVERVLGRLAKIDPTSVRRDPKTGFINRADNIIKWSPQ